MAIPRRRPVSLILAIGASVLALPSCSHSTPEPATPEEREAAIVVTVNNRAYSDVNIYAVAQGSRRLGTARASSTTTLSMPASYLTPTSRTVRLKGSPIGGGRDILSQQITVQPGAILEWTIDNNMTTSSILMR